MPPPPHPRPVRPPALTDGVVALRELRHQDVDALVTYARDAEMERWTTIPRPYTPGHARQWVARAQEGRRSGKVFNFAIESGGHLVGDVDLRVQGTGLAEVGFGLAPAHRGQGLMTRALRLALPWAFERAGVEVVHWRAQVGNWASRRVAWAVGFRVGPPVPGLMEHRGTRVDGWVAGLRRGDALHPVHAWFDPVRVTGRSVVLRAHRDGDLPRMVEAGRDPESRHWLGGLPADQTERDAREHLEWNRAEAAAGRAVRWAVADPDTDELLGEVGVVGVDPALRQAEIGYWVHPGARGRGVATEATRCAARHALLPVADGGLGLVRVGLLVAEGNDASLRVARKAGFTCTGRDRAADPRRDGTRTDRLRFDLLADELPAVR